MEDVTAAVIRLERAYESMMIARRRVADEVRAEYRAVIRREIERRQEDIEREFAKELALENARGLPGSVIRKNVLHTEDWGRWKKWRDLAEIEPERVQIQNAKKEAALAASPFRWADDYSTLTVLKYGDTTLDEPVVFDMSTNQINPIHGMFWPDSQDEDAEREARKVAGGVKPWLKFIDAEIRSRIDAGNVADPAEN